MFRPSVAQEVALPLPSRAKREISRYGWLEPGSCLTVGPEVYAHHTTVHKTNRKSRSRTMSFSSIDANNTYQERHGNAEGWPCQGLAV